MLERKVGSIGNSKGGCLWPYHPCPLARPHTSQSFSNRVWGSWVHGFWKLRASAKFEACCRRGGEGEGSLKDQLPSNSHVPCQGGPPANCSLRPLGEQGSFQVLHFVGAGSLEKGGALKQPWAHASSPGSARRPADQEHQRLAGSAAGGGVAPVVGLEQGRLPNLLWDDSCY